ncbi:alpha-tubulin N-acetyltransferase 1 isoform X1 [Ictalurus punctatus]|uniref:Alpha-tubulin N-acetyltransferase 1 n=1 Tax=Ictalurus punctatus TaxID=7998 RepID=A0A2D0S483_ICTPU|nr:alpha-tubulin N-acetyltransferase 1 isoform X1 [Ictalurus punctatus]
MDFPFDLNSVFPERISVLDHNLCAARKAHGRPEAQNQTATVIDELGKASAKAQTLPAPITSAAKLQANKHYLYLLKDGERNGGRGVAVGYLKVGYKKLFLLDQRGAHVETEPLCVLDFYVTESLQRHGYGLELFHFMLEHKKVEPEQMAYDRPSSKFLAFLEKHFELKHSVPQVNNFVVFEGFFRNRSAGQLRKAPPKKPEGEIKPYSLMEREAVREEQKALPWPFIRSTAVPQSPPLAASSPYSRSLSVGSSPNRTPRPQPHIPPHLADNYRTKRTSSQGLVARNNLYSRHVNSRSLGLLTAEQLPGLKPVLSERVCDAGGQADALGHTNTAESTHLQGSSAFLPPLPAVPGQQAAERPALNGASRAARKPRREEETERDGRSWTVGEKSCTAQWVRQKHELRSTRPW